MSSSPLKSDGQEPIQGLSQHFQWGFLAASHLSCNEVSKFPRTLNPLDDNHHIPGDTGCLVQVEAGSLAQLLAFIYDLPSLAGL